nr:hypothetical protein [Flavobacterium selenitireducens]
MKNDIKLIPFRADLAEHFKQLNLSWISTLFEVEESDRLLLDDPQRNIIDKGGAVFFWSLMASSREPLRSTRRENGNTNSPKWPSRRRCVEKVWAKGCAAWL